MNNINILPEEIVSKIILFAHPKINDQLKLDIHNFKFKKFIQRHIDTFNLIRFMVDYIEYY